MDREENKIPRADIRWYHNVGFVVIMGTGALIIMAGFLFVGSLF